MSSIFDGLNPEFTKVLRSMMIRELMWSKRRWIYQPNDRWTGAKQLRFSRTELLNYVVVGVASFQGRNGQVCLIDTRLKCSNSFKFIHPQTLQSFHLCRIVIERGGQVASPQQRAPTVVYIPAWNEMVLMPFLAMRQCQYSALDAKCLRGW